MVAGGKIQLAGKDDYVFFNPNTADEISWSMAGPADQTLIVTFEDSTRMSAVGDPSNPNQKKRLNAAAGLADCEAHKYTISIDPPGVADPLDPVIIIRY